MASAIEHQWPGCGKKAKAFFNFLSPSNTEAEIQEKAKLYFDAGANEVWLCAPDGGISFLGPTAMRCSRLCPQFLKQVQFR
jgi:hypothetical protein